MRRTVQRGHAAVLQQPLGHARHQRCATRSAHKHTAFWPHRPAACAPHPAFVIAIRRAHAPPPARRCSAACSSMGATICGGCALATTARLHARHTLPLSLRPVGLMRRRLRAAAARLAARWARRPAAAAAARLPACRPRRAPCAPSAPSARHPPHTLGRVTAAVARALTGGRSKPRRCGEAVA